MRLAIGILLGCLLPLVGLCRCAGGGANAPQISYVSPIGNDANPGTLSQPWRTLTHAANTAVAGETVIVRQGTYAERLVPIHSGSDGAWISFQAAEGETVTINAAGLVPDEFSGAIDLSGRQYIHVAGFHVIDSAGAGIMADGSAHILIVGNTTRRTGTSGIGVWNSQDVVVRNNDVGFACTGGNQESISLGGVNTFEVVGNTVHDTPAEVGKEGIDAKDGSENGTIHNNVVHTLGAVGIYVDAWDKFVREIDVYNNVVYDVQDTGIAIACEMGGAASSIGIFNNLVYRCETGFGIVDWGGEGIASRPFRNITVVNNTFADNGAFGWGGGMALDANDVDGIVMRNNLCANNRSFQIAAGTQAPASHFSIDHNLVFGTFGEEETETRGTDFVEGDPRFVDAANGNYHLAPGSAAIDRGTAALAPATDLDGRSRPQGTAHDIGAFES